MHGACRDHYGRDIQAGSCHEHTRTYLVAVGEQDYPVKSVTAGHSLNQVRDPLPRRQAVAHPLMAHDDPVTYAGDTNQEGEPTASVDTLFQGPLQLPHSYVPGDDIGETGKDTDVGAL